MQDVDMTAQNTDQNDKLRLLPHVHNIIEQPINITDSDGILDTDKINNHQIKVNSKINWDKIGKHIQNNVSQHKINTNRQLPLKQQWETVPI